MYPITTCTTGRATVALLIVAAVLGSNAARAQLKPADHGAAAIDGNGLMWANTVGLQLTWSLTGGPGTAQAWIANLNATDYGGFNDWTLPTGDYTVGPNTTTNQLGELFYTDCGNTAGQQTALTKPGNNCRALSALGPVIQAGTSGFPGLTFISSSTFLGFDFQNCPDWAAYNTSQSGQQAFGCDSSYAGVVGRADVLAVRLAGVQPKDNSVVGVASVPEPNTVALLGIGLAGLALRWFGFRRESIRSGRGALRPAHSSR